MSMPYDMETKIRSAFLFGTTSVEERQELMSDILGMITIFPTTKPEPVISIPAYEYVPLNETLEGHQASVELMCDHNRKHEAKKAAKLAVRNEHPLSEDDSPESLFLLEVLFPPARRSNACTGYIPMAYVEKHKVAIAKIVKDNNLRRIYRGPRFGNSTSTRVGNAHSMVLYRK